MTTHVYTVYERGAPEEGDAVFVREGFSIFGFVFSFFWLFFHRAWFAGFVVLMLWLLIIGAPFYYDLNVALAAGLRLVLLLAVGVFAFDLWRDALERRGYVFRDVAVGGNREEAEMRYYARFAGPEDTAPGGEEPPPQIVTA